MPAHKRKGTEKEGYFTEPKGKLQLRRRLLRARIKGKTLKGLISIHGRK